MSHQRKIWQNFIKKSTAKLIVPRGCTLIMKPFVQVLLVTVFSVDNLWVDFHTFHTSTLMQECLSMSTAPS